MERYHKFNEVQGQSMKVECLRVSNINLKDKSVDFHDAVSSMILLTFGFISRKRCAFERYFEVCSISS